MRASTSSAVGGCCSRWGCDGADASDATLRATSPQRTAWCSAARMMAWIWRIVAGARPRSRSEEYSRSRWPAVSFDSRIGADRRHELACDAVAVVVERRGRPAERLHVLQPSLQQLGHRRVLQADQPARDLDLELAAARRLASRFVPRARCG